jgi:hypothetical protein
MKYELTENSIKVGYMTLYQIRALKDFGDVKAGDLGGYIEQESNLSQDGECWIKDGTAVVGKIISGHDLVYHNKPRFDMIIDISFNVKIKETLKLLAEKKLSIYQVDKELLNNFDFMLEAVKIDGNNLMWASDEQKNDDKIVLEAVKQNGLALRWASYRLSYNLEIVLEAIKKDGVAIKFASDTIVQEVIFKLGYDKMIKLLEQKVESSNKNN